ncbi:MAG: DUF1989 domain-containing protein [bacterium]
MEKEVVVKAGHGGRVDVASGQILEIENVEGAQILDFFAFCAGNVREFLSPGHCRSKLGRTTLEVGDQLVSVLRRPMFELVADSCRQNDFLAAACDPMRYLLDFDVQQHRSCRINLAEVMAPERIPYEYLPDPINFFQNSPILPDGRAKRGKSPANPGDKIVLRALMDVIAAGSACPQDQTDANGFNVTDVILRVRDA